MIGKANLLRNTLWFLCVFLIVQIHCEQCEATHLQFFSNYSLGKQDQLNRTFTKVAQRVSTLDSVSYVSGDYTYTVSNVKPKFFYIDSKQTAIISQNYIVVMGGRLEVTMSFSWSKKGSRLTSEGTGIAIALSNEADFSKVYKVQGDFLVEEVQSYAPIIFSNTKTKITRIDPATTSQEDISSLQKMFNPIQQKKSVTDELSAEIQKNYFWCLNQSLYDDRRNVHDHYQYQWVNNFAPGKSLNISYSVNMTDSDIADGGVKTFYRLNIPDFQDWRCQFPSPKLELDPRIYGGVQEFITLDVYYNTLKYAINNKALDTDLNRQNWESRFFQFYAGDLYEVIPALMTNYHATDKVSGECRASPIKLNVTKGGHEFLNVTIQYNCDLFIGNDKIANFRVNLLAMVQGFPQTKQMHFKVINSTHTVDFSDYMEYKIENKQLAEHMVTHSLNRLRESNVFGSGWPLYTRDYPHFMVEDNYTIVYDSTHVGTNYSQKQNKLSLEQ